MVQGYSQAHSSYLSGWNSFIETQGVVSRCSCKGGESCTDSCNRLYEQWNTIEAEELKLRFPAHISDGTLSNRLLKGSEYLKELIPHLKNIALEKDAFVNCDETWCRVRKHGKYSKKYIYGAWSISLQRQSSLYMMMAAGAARC